MSSNEYAWDPMEAFPVPLCEQKEDHKCSIIENMEKLKCDDCKKECEKNDDNKKEISIVNKRKG